MFYFTEDRKEELMLECLFEENDESREIMLIPFLNIG